MIEDANPRRPRRPYFWAVWWSILIGVVLFSFAWVIAPSISCSTTPDYGGGGIRDEVPEGKSLSGAQTETPQTATQLNSARSLTTRLSSASGFPPQRRCRLLESTAGGSYRVIAEADYPTTGALVVPLLMTLSPILGVAMWRAIRRRRPAVPIR